MGDVLYMKLCAVCKRPVRKDEYLTFRSRKPDGSEADIYIHASCNRKPQARK